LTGNSGSDTFVIKDGIISDDIITDFNANDPNEKIDITNFKNSIFSGAIRDINQLNMAQVGSDVKIAFNNFKTLTVKNVQISQLTIDKFIGLTDNYNSTSDLTVDGTYHDETLNGGKGNDTIRSNGGNDSIFAGAGNDKLYGESGNNSFTGEAGSDIFTVQGNYGSDVITDFNVSDSNEKIDLSSFKDVATDLSQLIMNQIGLDTKISFIGKNKTILVKNVQISQLTIDKFIGLTDIKSNPSNLVLNGTLSNDTLTGGA
jgi:Ca2+-binding RTX toxin-like protein